MPTSDYKVVVRADKTPIDQHERQYNAPNIHEVAIVIVDEEFNSRDIILCRRNDDVQRVLETHCSYDGLHYPILFWQGEDGYHLNTHVICNHIDNMLTIQSKRSLGKIQRLHE